MTVRPNDTLLYAKPRLNVDALIFRLDRPDSKDIMFLRKLAVWAQIAGVDDAVLAAMWLVETANGASVRWNNDFNPGGIGIPADSTVQPFPIANADEAARIFVQCVYALTKRLAHPKVPIPATAQQWFGQVWLPKVQSSRMPNVVTVSDLNLHYTDARGQMQATWAWNPDHITVLISRAKTYLPDVPDQEFSLPHEGGEPVVDLIPVYKNIIPRGAPNRPGTKLPATGDLFIVEHETGNDSPGADADNQIAYLQTAEARQRYVSYHFSVDDEKIVQGLPLDEIGYHAGDGCDDPSVDIGCFRSVAIEGCINRDGNEALMRKHYSQLIGRIAAGDPAFDWGSGSTKGRFSARKTRTHIQVSDPGPNQHHCPDHMLRDGYVPTLNADAMAIEDALKGGVIISPPVVKPASIYPRGMSLKMAQIMFGELAIKWNGVTQNFHFDPKGPVSIEWLRRIKAQLKDGQDYSAAKYGELKRVTRRGKDKVRWDFYFSDGSTIPYDSEERHVIA